MSNNIPIYIQYLLSLDTIILSSALWSFNKDNMNLSALVILITLGSAATKDIIIDEDFYDKSDIIYTSQHEIVNIFKAPCNAQDNLKNIFLFFVEADQSNGKNTYQGLYVRKFSEVENITKLVLENGKDITCDADKIYIGAKDGIYIFNEQEMKAEKYGSITINIKNIAKVNGSDLFYILTEDNKLYRVTEYGNKMTLDDTIVDAQQIVLDKIQNLYYYLPNNEVWVVSEGVKTKFISLPKEINYLRLLKPPILFQEGIPLVINNNLFLITVNEFVYKLSNFSVIIKPSAYSMEAGKLQFYGHNKKIYLYNY